MAKKQGISKATGYRKDVFSVVYDLKGAIEAFGPEFILWLTNEITSGTELRNTTQALEAYQEYKDGLDLDNFDDLVENDDHASLLEQLEDEKDIAA